MRSIKKIEKDIKKLNKELRLTKQSQLLQCGNCEKTSKVKDWVLIRDHHYIRPYSCTGGDYWSFSNEYHLVCPECQGIGRIYKGSWMKKDDKDLANYEHIRNLASHFGEKLNAYGNNYTLESLRQEAKERIERGRY